MPTAQVVGRRAGGPSPTSPPGLQQAMTSLSLVYAVGGCSVLLASVVEVLQGGRPNTVGIFAAPVVLVVAALVHRFRDHGRLSVIHSLVGLAVLVVLAMIAVTRRPEGAMTVAGVLPCIAMLTAWTFSRTVARLYAAASCVGLAVAITVAGHSRMDVAVASICAVVVAVTEVQSRLVGRLREALVTDHLTGLLNRRGVIAMLEREIPRSRRTGRPLHLAVVDLDGFKSVNDTHGHAAGDDLLCALTRSWVPVLGAADRLARLGGDEFLVVMPDASPEQARMTVERMRHTHIAPWTFGLALLEGDHGPSELIALADERLLSAKSAVWQSAAPRQRRWSDRDPQVRVGG